MPARRMSVFRKVLFVALAVLSAPAAAFAHGGDKAGHVIPSAQQVAQMLQEEPITQATWPQWRTRLLDWITDRSRRTDAAWRAAWDFVRKNAIVTKGLPPVEDKALVVPIDRPPPVQVKLPPPLSEDAFAWYLLGRSFFSGRNENEGKPAIPEAEAALRRSLQLDPNFARAHRSLALVLLMQDTNATRAEAQKEITETRRLDPTLSAKEIEAYASFHLKRYADAERLYQEVLREDPKNDEAARGAAAALIFGWDKSSPLTPRMKSLLDRFPNDPVLICFHALALHADKRPREAKAELDRVRSMGADPSQIIWPQAVEAIEKAAAPGWLERFTWIMAYIAGFYLAVMALMAGAGAVLSSRTRGVKALDLLGAHPDELITAGQVLRTRHESLLATFYSFALFMGLILFYGTIPFVIAGLLAATAGLLYAIFLLPRIPIKLIVVIVVVGGGMAWAVLKSLFARAGSGGFGIAKTATDCPKLYQTLAEVAERVDTDPVDEVYLAPGSSIGVHQEGRGPFGILGVKKRVLTLGLSTMHFLTVTELKSILAHEYAHFSHRDTFYSRFIYKVHMSIEQALDGMGAAGGRLNYVNPFFWFLYFYYKSYSLLSAGYSRSREFLADRMAVSLYGSDVFASALTKVCTDGQLFESTIYQNIEKLLEQDKAFVNMYESFRTYLNQELTEQQRKEMYEEMLKEKASLFASHPTIGERIEAAQALPASTTKDTVSALQLFEQPEEIEKELTDFLTAVMHHVHQLQAAGTEAG